MRLYDAACNLLEAMADYLHTGTLEHQFEKADWEADDSP